MEKSYRILETGAELAGYPNRTGSNGPWLILGCLGMGLVALVICYKLYKEPVLVAPARPLDCTD